jgi:hypothetical protein
MRAGKALIEATLAYIESQPTAVTNAMVARHLKRSSSHLSGVLTLLATENKLTVATGTTAKGSYTVLYRPYGFPLVPPEGMVFTDAAERRKPERPIKGEQPKRVMTAAKQIGMARHWLDRALFGDGPAHSDEAVA